MTENNLVFWCDCAKVALKSGDYQQALKYYNLALEVDYTSQQKQENLKLWCDRARKSKRSGDYRQALKYYDMALEINPHEYKLWHERGWALSKLKEYSAAITSYNTGIALLGNT